MVAVDVEQVVAWDPDVILLGNFDAAMPEDVYRSPAWRSLSAVRSRRVYKVPSAATGGTHRVTSRR